MYHSVLFMKNRGVAVIMAGAVMASLWSSAAYADVLKCQRTLVKESTKVERKRAKALRKCYDAALKAGTPAACPDPDNASKIADAETKFHDKVTKDCTAITVADVGFSGLVSRCVGGDNDGGLCTSMADCTAGVAGVCTPQDECPNLYNGNLAASCTAPLTSVDDVADCLVCNGANVVGAPLTVAYGNDPVPLPSIEAAPRDVLKCQRNVGKSTAKYFDKVRKALSKCKDAALKAGSGTCPDAAANTNIGAALTKFQEKVAKDCTDATFPNGLNRANLLGSISIPVTAGPLRIPAVDSFDNYRDVLNETVDQLAQCSSELGTGDILASCEPLCGNGKIEAGEDCDDGNQVNGDACPSDCKIATCTATGTVTATVTFTPPTGIDLAGIQVLVGYPEDKVRIPGSGNSSQVLNRVAATDGTAALAGNDLNYAIRLLVNTDGSVAIAGAPSLATIDFDTCSGAPAVTDGDFVCVVQDTSAFGTVADQVFATTCSVDVP